jgi:Peptidase family S41
MNGIRLRMSCRLVCLSILALLAPSYLAAQNPEERDWAEALRKDAEALHNDIATNHPGPVNTADPDFGKNNDRQLAIAIARAGDAKTYADYFFALREYVASFDDGHMSFGAFGNTPNDYNWPGFLTDYNQSGEIIVRNITESSAVPIGAKLIACDSLTAEQYAQATLGKMWGRWQLEAQRRSNGPFLFLDEGSRYIARAKSCSFNVKAEIRTVILDWKPIRLREYVDLSKVTQSPSPKSFETRILDDGIFWFSMPSFNGHPDSPAGKALPPMIARMRTDRPRIAAATAIILDLRGNGGGSSDWSRQMANALWGGSAIRRLTQSNVRVDWRASQANLDAIENGYRERGAGQAMSSDIRDWYETTIAGLSAAIEQGDLLWRHPESKDPTSQKLMSRKKEGAAMPLPPVFFVTDEKCGSACLDAVDLWLALGAVHVGRTTSADTLYMETRSYKLPSGITGGSMPMKVYRGRPRKSNEPAVPKHIFDGDINDTAALEQWIANLEARPVR